MCSCDDFDGPSCSTSTLRVAKKNHTCYECGKPIQKGDIYKYTSGVWDGRPSSFKWCDTCTTIHNLTQGLTMGDFCFIFGGLIECVEEGVLRYERVPDEPGAAA